MIQSTYKDILAKGNNNKYYEQSYDERRKLIQHVHAVTGIVVYRGPNWEDSRDWKQFRAEMMEPVKWAKGKYSWNPSVDDMLWAFQQLGFHEYNGQPARVSVKMVDNFNKYCSIIAKMWNTYNPEYKMTADEIQIKMTEEITQNPLGHLSKFIIPNKPNQPKQPKGENNA